MRTCAAALAWLIEQHASRIVVGFVLAAAVLAVLFPLRIGHDYDDWIDHTSAHYRAYAALVRDFGDAGTLMAVFDPAALDDARRASYFDLVARLGELRGVTAVLDPVALFLGAGAAHAADAADSARATAYRQALVSRDAATVALVMLLDPAARADHRGAVTALADGFAALGIAADFAGTAYFSAVLEDTIATDLGRVLGILAVVALVLLKIFLRDTRLVLAIFVGIGLAEIYALAVAAALGLTLNLLTLLVLPLVFGVGMTTAVHLFTRRVAGEWRYADAIARVLAPAAGAAFTTAIGCGAFYFAPQALISRMGVVMPLAVLASFLTAIVFVPAAVRVLAQGRPLPALAARRVRVPARAQGVVAAGMLLLGGLALTALPRLATDPDALSFFAEGSTLERAYRSIEARLTGLLVCDLVIRSTDGDDLREQPHAARIGRFVAALATLPELTSLVSGYELGWMEAAGIERVPGLTGKLFTPAGDATRLVLRLRNVGARPWPKIDADIERRWNAEAHAGLGLVVTGLIPLILEAQDRLLVIQSRMLPVVLAVVCVVMLIVFRAPRLLVPAVLANFLPLLITAGVMAWCAIPVNSINLFVGSVMLGIVVDDTIHLLHAWRGTGSIERALDEVGDALWITSVVVGLAFAALLLSTLVPVRQFGLLSLLAVASAWLCDVCLLPVLLRQARSPA